MTIIQGDCLDIMRTMEDNSIDFIVTDPPYGLHFMGKHWDGRIPAIEIWAEALRICKPGSMLAAFGGSRTHHHLMCAIEGAGWEIRDCMMWIYGSGFPKSHNHFGLDGYGTALKPAYEPIILAMKPLDGTYAQNAEKWGVAGINIDEGRVETSENITNHARSLNSSFSKGIFGNSSEQETHQTKGQKLGRWPANIILDEEAGKMLDQQSGISKSKASIRKNNAGMGIHDSPTNTFGKGDVFGGFNDSGGASRFFYCAKASSSERNMGLEGMPMKQSNPNFGSGGFSRPTDHPEREIKPSPNHHPTVKPISLMRYLIKLLAPPGNPTLLDSFAGSGSTLVAAAELGINAIGIEREAEYCEIAKKRIEYSLKQAQEKAKEPEQLEFVI